MPSIVLSHLSFGYDATRAVLENLDLSFDAGWHGVVGANGAGKSTLLALVTGALAPTRGHVMRSADIARVAFVPQATEQRTPTVDALTSRYDRIAARWCGRLSVDPAELTRWDTLSPGERMRAHLCAALVDEPDVLVLDEPTNHLDTEAREQVLAALARFSGIGLLVSHDRAWLDALCAQTVWLEDGGARAWSGGYTAAAEGRAQHRAAARAARDVARAEVSRLVRSTENAQRARVSAERMISTKHRARSPKDNDARGILARTRAEWAEARLGRAAATRDAQLGRAQEALAALPRVRAERGRALTFASTGGGGPLLLSLDGQSVCAGERVVLRDVHVALRRGERVWLRGENGAGKTSLMRALMRARERPRALYVPQELDRDLVTSHQQDLLALPPDARGRAFQRLAALGCDPTIVTTSAAPSLGEARKLVLAAGLARPLDAILLDEPTNHLDLPSIERLERALGDFPGALLIVSHDERFAEALCDTVWTIAGGEVR